MLICFLLSVTFYHSHNPCFAIFIKVLYSISVLLQGTFRFTIFTLHILLTIVELLIWPSELLNILALIQYIFLRVFYNLIKFEAATFLTRAAFFHYPVAHFDYSFHYVGPSVERVSKFQTPMNHLPKEIVKFLPKVLEILMYLKFLQYQRLLKSKIHIGWSCNR